MRQLSLVGAVVIACSSPLFAQNSIRVLAANKTSTLQKEMNEAADGGYHFVGMTVADTLIGGSEIVCILRKIVD